jgi:hypothetical protein
MDSRDPAEAIRPKLASDEKLLWSGTPEPGVRFRDSDVLVVPFTWLWLAFVLLIFGEPLFSGGQISVIGAVFILFGLYAAFGRFFVEAVLLGGTSYGVTSQRIIIVTPGRIVGGIKSLDLRALPELVMDENPNGTGTIYFGPKPRLNSPRKIVPCFDGISGVRKVYELIRQAQRGQ